MANVTFTITLPKSIRGSGIIEVAKVVIGKEFHQEKVIEDDKTLFTIGRNSQYPYKDAVIAVGANRSNQIDPDANYTELAVKNTEFPGAKYAVGYSDDDIVKWTKQLRDQLKAALES